MKTIFEGRDRIPGKNERQVAEENLTTDLRESRKYLQTVLSGMPVILWVIETDGSIRFAEGRGLSDPAFQKIPMEASSIYRLYPEDSGIREVVGSVFAGDRRTVVSQWGERIYKTHFSPLTDESGRNNEILGLSLDITGRIRLEEALREQNETLESRICRGAVELDEKNRMLVSQSRLASLGEMIGFISHQWRQPLNVLGLHLQNLRFLQEGGGLDPEYLSNTLASCMKIIDHMSGTVEIFRSFFREKSSCGTFSLNETILNTLRLEEASCTYSGIEITERLGRDFLVNGNPDEFGQALLCLLSNAREALNVRKTEKPGITIETNSLGEKEEILVRDNAGGIPDPYLNRIFDPYFSTKENGTGIGLYLSRSIIEKMGGKLEVRNTDSGAEFRIEIG